MFICRHHLLRVNALKSLPLRPARTALFSTHISALRHAGSLRFASSSAASNGSGLEARGRTGGVHSQPATTPVAPDPAHSPPSSVETVRAAATPFSEPDGPVADPDELEAFTYQHHSEELKLKLRRFIKHQRRRDVETLIQDIIKLSEDNTVYHDVLIFSLGLVKPSPVFSIHTMRLLVDALQTHVGLSKIPLSLVTDTIRATLKAATQESNAEDEVPIYLATAPLLVDSLPKQNPETTPAVTNKVSPVLSIIFRMIFRLVQLEKYEEVMPIFDTLVTSGTIPESALKGLPTTGFAPIVLTALLRCCIEWGWRSRAVHLLLLTPEWEKAKSPAFDSVIDQVMEFIFESEEENATPALVSALMVRILNSPDVVSISDRVLQTYYDMANKHGSFNEARAIFELTRSKELLARRQYPPPQGGSWVWMVKVAAKVKNIHLTRALVEEAVEGRTEILPASRAWVIMEASSKGFMSCSRTLWERFQDDPFVAGNAGMAVRLTSLVVSRIGSLTHRARVARSREMPAGSDSNSQGTPPSDTDQDRAEDVTANAGEAESGHDASPRPGDAPVQEDSAEALDEQIADHRAFADRVLAALRQCHEPLDAAPHETLNALARMYIMLNQVQEGFAMFKVLQQRNEPLDMFDVNVALSALSQYNARMAVGMLSRMVNMGVSPDPVSFGTVIHHAVLQDEMTLVTKLIVRARQVGIKELDYKTVGTLVRAAISAPYKVDFPHQTQLQNVTELVQSLVDAGYIIAPGIGADCVHAALRANDPKAAFEFWQLYVKDKVDHGDRKHAAVRSRIARNITLHLTAGALHPLHARSMLKELGPPPPR